MKHVIHIFSIVVLGCAGLFCVPASALTLGRMQGGALIGQPLSLLVGVQANGDVPDPTCFRAKVRYGDIDLRANQIALDYVSNGAGTTLGVGESQSLRVRTTVAVNEPTVTVQLDSACAQHVSRTYVLLSEWGGESTLATSDDVKPSTVITPAARASDNVPTNTVGVVEPKTLSVTAPVLPPVKIARSHPRLQLSPAPAAGKSVAVTSSALDALGQRIDSIAQRQDAIEAADKSLQTQANMDMLKGQLLSVQQLTVKNQQNLMALAALVDHSSSGLTGNVLIWVTGFLMLLVLAMVTWFYLQLRKAETQGDVWWINGVKAGEGGSGAVFPGSTKAAAPTPTPAVQVVVPITPKSGDQPAIPQGTRSAGLGPLQASDSVSDVVEKPLGTPVRHIVTRLERRDFAHSAPNSLRFINTKEMLDVRQQADFFVALGQHERAIKVLENSIASGEGANPLVYLDLLSLHKDQGAVAQFEQLREEFNAQFTGRVPSFDQFGDDGADLESYADVCEELVVLWGRSEALGFIEMCLVRVAGDEPAEELTFDLNAFRELLLLHSVLKRHDEAQDSALIPFSASRMHVGASTGPSGLGVGSGQASLAPAPDPIPVPVPPVRPMTVQSVDLDLGEFDPKTSQAGMIDFDLSAYGKVPNKKPGA